MRSQRVIGGRALLVAALGAMCLPGAVVRAESMTGVDLALIPALEKIRIGQIVKVKLLATTTTGNDLSIDSVQSIIEWDPTKLELLGVSPNDPPHYPWLFAGFEDDSSGDNVNQGVNDPPFGVPANDGDAFFRSRAQPMPPMGIGPPVLDDAGLQVIHFAFRGVGAAMSTDISLVPQVGSTISAVYLTGAPGSNALRSLTSTHIRVNVPEPVSLALLGVGVALGLHRRTRGTKTGGR